MSRMKTSFTLELKGYFDYITAVIQSTVRELKIEPKYTKPQPNILTTIVSTSSVAGLAIYQNQTIHNA